MREERQGWHNDPTGRHAERWFVGGRVTSRVRDGRVESVDPLSRAEADVTAVPAPREGWWSDPLGHHEERWFSLGLPTALVRDRGREGHDPVPPSQLGDAAYGTSVLTMRLPEAPGPYRSDPLRPTELPAPGVNWMDAARDMSVATQFAAQGLLFLALFAHATKTFVVWSIASVVLLAVGIVWIEPVAIMVGLFAATYSVLGLCFGPGARRAMRSRRADRSRDQGRP